MDIREKIEEDILSVEQLSNDIVEALGNLQKKIQSLEQNCKNYTNRDSLQDTYWINFTVSLMSLYSASNYPGVIRALTDIITNIIGVEGFELYFIDSNRDSVRLNLILRQGEISNAIEPEKAFDKVQQSKEHWLRTENDMSTLEPLGVFPSVYEDRVLGFITIYELLHQKDVLSELDIRLLDALGFHASNAIICSKLKWIFERESKMNLREEIKDLMPPTPSLAISPSLLMSRAKKLKKKG